MKKRRIIQLSLWTERPTGGVMGAGSLWAKQARKALKIKWAGHKTLCVNLQQLASPETGVSLQDVPFLHYNHLQLYDTLQFVDKNS
jgi:hypothetical protein